MKRDWSAGEVIAAYEDGTIVLDDGITTWNPERAKIFLRGGKVAGREEVKYMSGFCAMCRECGGCTKNHFHCRKCYCRPAAS
jgi:hypothetical protein